MEGRPYSRWDTGATPQETADNPVIALGMATPAERARIRTFMCEELLRLAAAGDDAGLPALGERLAASLRRRRVYWSTEADTPGHHMVTAMVALYVALLLFIAAGAVAGVGGFACGIVLAAPILAVSLWRLRAAGWSDPGEALKRRSCPECRYDLSTLPPAIEPSLVDGEWLGPRVCPECGAPWPMVPPDAPRDWKPT